jgi:hypothetical protein
MISNVSNSNNWVQLARGKGASSRWDRDLISIAERVSVLLASQKVQNSYFAFATLDDLLGAIYAFVLAFHNQPSFKYRPVGKKIDPHVIVKRARSISQAHRIRLSGKWMAGFHFNSALFRLLAVYHRVLKIAVGKPRTGEHIGDETDPKSLLHRSKGVYKSWTGKQWDNIHINTVRTEVNDLKHDSAGIYWGRRVKESDAIAAVEELLKLFEAWELHG